MRFLADWLLPRCIVAALMIGGVARPVPAGAYLHCSTTRIVIVSAATGERSSRSEENLSFVIDDAARTLAFVDGGSLTVTRFDKTWISANRDDIFYEFNRQDGTLSFASATTKNNIASTIVGSGRCKEVGAAGNERGVVAPEAEGGQTRCMTWTRLDEQMAAWSARLVSEVKISENDSLKLGTKIASDVRFLPRDAKAEIAGASPVPVRDRLQELQAFQGWMDTVAKTGNVSPVVVRAQVITQNYICFVYLPESCFRILAKSLPSGSVTRQCAKFLSNDRIRAFRNAIAHANWAYRSDFSGITYWARKGADLDVPLSQFEVLQQELTFWQALSRCVAYAAFSNLD